MNIIRRVKTRDFTIVENKMLRDRKLSYKAKGLLGYLLSHKDGWSITLRNITFLSLEGVDAIESGVKELVAAGYVKMVRSRNDKGEFDVTYYVSDCKEDLTCVDYPDGFIQTGSSRQDNPDRSSSLYKKTIKENYGKKSSSVRAALVIYGINESMIKNVEDVIDDDDDVRFFYDMIKRIDDEVKTGKIKRVVPYVITSLSNFVNEVESEEYINKKAEKKEEREAKERKSVERRAKERNDEMCQKFYDGLRRADKEVLYDEAIANLGDEFRERYGIFMLDGRFDFSMLPDSGKLIVIAARNEILLCQGMVPDTPGKCKGVINNTTERQTEGVV